MGGEASQLLQPLVEVLRRYVMAADKLHADDTPVPVLAPGNGKTKTGRLWIYVRDDRASGASAPPAVWFAYSPDRKGEHAQQHLSGWVTSLALIALRDLASLSISCPIRIPLLVLTRTYRATRVL